MIIGFGTIAMGHAVGYQRANKIGITAVVDPVPARRSVATERFGLRAYASIDEMLRNESPEFIDICTPPNSHHDYIERGLAEGLHVLCEKPVLMPSNGGYDRLLESILSAESVFYPCHNYKFAPILELMESVVRTPGFGEVLNAKFRTLRRGHAVGVPEWNPHWRRNPEISGGGILRDHGPHSLYLATHLSGRTPVAVSCLTGNMLRDEYSTEDTAMLTVRCADDVQISLDLTWSAAYRNSYYSIVGTGGSVVVENDDVQYSIGGKVSKTRLESNFDDPSHTDWFVRLFADFLERVAQPARLPALLEETLMTSLVIDSAYLSAADGGNWVELATSPADLMAGAVRR